MRKFLFLWLIIIPFTINAQQLPATARAMALGGIGQMDYGPGASYYNQAALALQQSRISAIIFYRGLLGVPGLSDRFFALSYKPWDNAAIAIDYHFSGFRDYSSQRAGIAYGMRAARSLYLGAQVNMHMIHQPAYYGNIYTATAELSLLFQPTDNLAIASHVFNVWYFLLDKNYPAMADIALQYRFSHKALVAAEVEKQLDQPVIWRWGATYTPVKNLGLSLGGYLQDNIYTITFGLGYSYKWLDISFGFESHPLLGMTSGITLGFSL